MGMTDHKDFIGHVVNVKKEMKLNDWGFHFLLYKSGYEIYNGNRNMSLLFVWFISSKAGYESRVGYTSDRIYLLMPSKNKLYSIPFLTIKGKRYYAQYYDQHPVKFKKLFSYQGEYPGQTRLMDYGFKQAPMFTISSEKRDVRFRCNGKDYSFPIFYNQNLIQFYRYYPQTELPLYFRAAMPKETGSAMLQSLETCNPWVVGKRGCGCLAEICSNRFCLQDRCRPVWPGKIHVSGRNHILPILGL